MVNDPIVAEIRAIRDKLAAACNYDIRKIVEEARRRQHQSQARVVSYQDANPAAPLSPRPVAPGQAHVG